MTEEKYTQETEVVTLVRLQSVLDNMETNSSSLIEVIRRLQGTCQKIGLDINYEGINMINDPEIIGILNLIDVENKIHRTLLEYIFKLTILLEKL